MKRVKQAAFTRTDLLLVLLSVTIILVLVNVPSRRGCYGVRNRCTANLKQIALAFNLWAQDHQNRFPMEVPVTEGGTREYALAGGLLPNFVIASNELRAAEILFCPEDKKRKPMKNFSDLTINNVSYFLNADAAQTNQNHIIAGDRNLTFAGSNVKPGLLVVANVATIGWGKGLHDYEGNVGLVDASAHQVTSKGLRDVLALGGSTNRVIIP